MASVDTKKLAKSRFAFNSNTLGDLGRYLGVGGKLKHAGFGMWLGCMGGDAKAWRMMRLYNRQDVLLLERVYEKLKPYAINHPSLSAISERDGCPICGSGNVIRKGIRANASGIRQQMKCKCCGGWYLTRYRKK